MMVAKKEGTVAEHEARMWIGGDGGKWEAEGGDSGDGCQSSGGSRTEVEGIVTCGARRNAKARTVMS